MKRMDLIRNEASGFCPVNPSKVISVDVVRNWHDKPRQGRASTVSNAGVLSAEPYAFTTKIKCVPALVGAMTARSISEFVAFAKFVPLNCHWNSSGAAPIPSTAKIALDPEIML